VVVAVEVGVVWHMLEEVEEQLYKQVEEVEEVEEVCGVVLWRVQRQRQTNDIQMYENG
jgi:hypothetical protein